MENEELLTTPEAETEDTVEITDGEPKVSEGAIFMIIGFAYLGIVHIFKKV